MIKYYPMGTSLLRYIPCIELTWHIVHKDLLKEQHTIHKNRARMPKPEHTRGINSGITSAMVLYHNKEESTLEAVGI